MRFRLRLFPGLDGVLDAWAADLNTFITPYQPNSIQFPNNAPTAGQIVQTKVSAGHPVQLDVTTRVENGQAQVAIYAMKPERVQVTEENVGPLALDGHGNGYFPVARTQKMFCIEIWTDTREDRQPLSDLIFQRYGISFDLTHTDGSTTKILYDAQVDDDADQTHTIYVRRFFFDVDFTLTQLWPTTNIATTVLTAATALVTSTTQTPPVEQASNL